MDFANRTVGDQGRYRIERPLGSGAMGEVFLTVDQRLRKQVVLKVLKADLASKPSVRERFHNEALIQANLEHRNVVRALDLVDDGDVFGIVMEFVQGPSLDDHLAREAPGPVPLARIVHVLDPVCAAIEYAHARGVVHRDLKPGNILLDRGSGVEEPRVADFGIAKLLSQAGRGLTREGAVLGTPYYMAPEQLKGLVDVDGRADVYALGVIAWQMAAGRMPHGESSEYEVGFRVLSGERLEPLAGAVPGIPPAFDAWVARATEPDREKRTPTVTRLREELRAVLDGRAPAVASSAAPRAVEAPPPPPPPKAPAASTRMEEPETPDAVPQTEVREARGSQRLLSLTGVGVAVTLLIVGIVVATRAANRDHEEQLRTQAIHEAAVKAQEEARNRELEEAAAAAKAAEAAKSSEALAARVVAAKELLADYASVVAQCAGAEMLAAEPKPNDEGRARIAGLSAAAVSGTVRALNHVEFAAAFADSFQGVYGKPFETLEGVNVCDKPLIEAIVVRLNSIANTAL